MTTPRKTGTRPTRAERRRLLVEQARLLFAVQGYRATTLEQVAAAPARRCRRS